MGYDDTWQLTFDPTQSDPPVRGDDGAWIAVRVRDDDDIADARELFARAGITAVEEHTADARGEHMVDW
jgi:hypothetical protein